MRIPDRSLATYMRDVQRLVQSDTTTEQTYYPAVRALLADVLRGLQLPSDVRVNTSERRAGGGIDLPDVGLYDGTGDFVIVSGEVKLPAAELASMAVSTERNDQIGRYLSRTRAVILCNVRSFGLLTIVPGFSAAGPVPPESRRLEMVVELWPSLAVLRQGQAPDEAVAEALAEMVETAVTRYAPIGEPETLARVLARQARRAKRDLPLEFGQAVKNLAEDFGKALGIAFEGTDGEEFFRSSLVQTVFYALFAGWLLHIRANKPGPFRWQNLPATLRIPFLGNLFHDIQHPERIADLNLQPALDQAAETLTRVEIETFFARLRLPSLAETADAEREAATAILYFYEPFLEAFDPDLRKRLGVWYTPPEIVRYQVRKIDRLLRDELGCELGLADNRVVVLDPACGTGAYLIEVAQCIAETLRREGVGADLPDRLISALCTRVFGFEILTAPFVISHLQLYLMLGSLGAEPASGERLAVFLTNALTGWTGAGQMHLIFPELQQEHDAARAVKMGQRIIVVLGNPPYNRYIGVPMEEEADLVDHYKGIERDEEGRQVGQTGLFAQWGIRKHLLDDLYIRFFRLAEKRIAEAAPYGIVSYISNSSFYTGRSHPIMRESLLQGFDAIWVDNLHGNRLASERTPNGESCETIFNMESGGPGIKVGTGITTLVKRPADRRTSAPTLVWYRDFWGRAEAKRRALLESLAMDAWSDERRREAAKTSEGPREYAAYTPTKENRWKLIPREDTAGYEDWPALNEMFPTFYQGVNPNRGLSGSIVEIDRAVLEARMRDYFSDLSDEEFAAKHPVLWEARAGYNPVETRRRLRKLNDPQESMIQPYEVFPLDIRWLYYDAHENLLNRRRPELWDNLADNELLVAVPQPRRISESLPLIATCLFDLHLHDRGSVGFPAKVRVKPGGTNLFDSPVDPEERLANLSESLWTSLKSRWNLSGDLSGEEGDNLARRLFRACLAICHAPQYQIDHADSLAQDSARIPVPADRETFERLADAGDRVAVLLNPITNARPVCQQVLGEEMGQLAVLRKSDGTAARGDDLLVTISHYGAAKGGWRPTADGMGNLHINANVYFENVPEAAWKFELGGYPVLKKWLGYRDVGRRPGQPLSQDDRDHFRGMVQRITALLVLHDDLDSLYGLACESVLTAGTEFS